MAFKKAVFTGYRGGLGNQRNKQILVKIDLIDTRDEAAKYIGRKVVWLSPTGNARALIWFIGIVFLNLGMRKLSRIE